MIKVLWINQGIFEGMNHALQITNLRLDDIPLLLGLLQQMGIAQIYDREIGDHGLHTGLSGGWMLSVWLAFIMSQCDHTKYKVEDWVARHQAVLESVTGQQIVPAQFNDNRLASLLSRLSQQQGWERFEAALWQHSIEIYDLASACVGGLHSAHVDSTTACGYHTPQPEGIMQRGYSKDHRPDLAQLKLMTVALHPHGQLAATQVVSGNTADDGLYLPIIARARELFGRVGLLFVGDSKMAALQTRAEIARAGDYYLTVAPLTGQTARALPSWIEAALSGKEATSTLKSSAGEAIGVGYELVRECTAQLPMGQEAAPAPFTFRERVQVFRADSLAAQQIAALDKRLLQAEAEVRELTPEPGRGRRQYHNEANLEAAIQEILEKHRVEALLRVTWKVEQQRQLRYLSRGRPGAHAQQLEVVSVRYQIKSVKREEKQIAAHAQRLGWRVQLSNAPADVSLANCVEHYRGNWRGERNYHRLKSEPLGLGPIYVRKDDQITGLTYLLTLAVRVEGVLEWQVARGLKAEQQQMKGLYAGLPKQATATPTAPAMLAAISREQITLTEVKSQGERTRQLSVLPELLVKVLRYLHLPLSLYTELRL